VAVVTMTWSVLVDVFECDYKKILTHIGFLRLIFRLKYSRHLVERIAIRRYQPESKTYYQWSLPCVDVAGHAVRNYWGKVLIFQIFKPLYYSYHCSMLYNAPLQVFIHIPGVLLYNFGYRTTKDRFAENIDYSKKKNVLK